MLVKIYSVLSINFVCEQECELEEAETSNYRTGPIYPGQRYLGAKGARGMSQSQTFKQNKQSETNDRNQFVIRYKN